MKAQVLMSPQVAEPGLTVLAIALFLAAWTELFWLLLHHIS
jgi:ABC-type glycerol-3-phosphate transport system permease component